MTDVKKKKRLSAILLLLFGSLSGFITGFLGAGGGLITILLLRYYSEFETANIQL